MKNLHELGTFLKNIRERFYSKISFNDRITGLPTLVSVFSLLDKLVTNVLVGLIYVDLEDFKTIEDIYGREVCDTILKNIADVLKRVEIDFFGPQYKLLECSLGGDDFLVFIEAPDCNDTFPEEYLKLKHHLENEMNLANHSLRLYKPLSIHLGYTNIQYEPDSHIETIIYKAIKEASHAAKQYTSSQEHAAWHEIREIIDQEKIRSVYQAIFSLKNGQVLGYEALSRGPAGTKSESPTTLFSVAEEFQCLQELENLCHRKAVSTITNELENKFLFLNINPLVLNHVNYERGVIQDIIRENHIHFHQVVLELTERTKIDDYAALRENLRFYRNLGFQIAIDDAGSGYSSLAAIAELQPEFVKIDLSLVRGVDQSPVKKAMLETLVGFCSRVNARIICEGIETVEELEVLSAIGCNYGQGFLMHRPGEMKTEPNPSWQNYLQSASLTNMTYANHPIKLGDISLLSDPIAPDLSVQKVVEMLKENRCINGMVVCDHQVPIGLVMRDKIFAMLSTRYGYDLFVRRSIAEVMDPNPLILSGNMSLEEAAPLVAERLESGSTDYIIIVQEQCYYGIVSVARLLDGLAKTQLECARDANPLTNLPGNKCISTRLENDLLDNNEIMVLYFDLDNFKSFNDYYGFEHGDRALVLLANIISFVVDKNGNEQDLVGHIGGDDFLVITTPNQASSIAWKVIELFDQRITELYEQSDLEQGFILSTNRNGQEMRFPIMTLSIAGVSNAYRSFSNHLQLSETAAEIKKFAKSCPGSCYKIDLRTN